MFYLWNVCSKNFVNRQGVASAVAICVLLLAGVTCVLANVSY
ncbi:hypothetical protein FDG94_gp090 [Pseudomonas phage SM1]|uniref:Uncharacterized protein n=1 Tax=Pseudomonas phage SM1 TaxID=1772332 RepID=A0A0U3C8R6_9CAUD|nr:hypothetical protein FDG94_gp090 [Pseudomonas phage SM1]ALT58082.1 hypothetical protein SM1_090 [Pseudomonas phage SM1]UVN14130.1 hypothetical protein FBPa45_0129 [Pseudomonas phage vB_PaeS_FBPa45]